MVELERLRAGNVAAAAWRAGSEAGARGAHAQASHRRPGEHRRPGSLYTRHSRASPHSSASTTGRGLIGQHLDLAGGGAPEALHRLERLGGALEGRRRLRPRSRPPGRRRRRPAPTPRGGRRRRRGRPPRGRRSARAPRSPTPLRRRGRRPGIVRTSSRSAANASVIAFETGRFESAPSRAPPAPPRPTSASTWSSLRRSDHQALAQRGAGTRRRDRVPARPRP